MNAEDLVPIEPAEALDKYLGHRANENVSDQTLQAHRYRLQHFVKWCGQEEIETLDDLDLRDLTDYKHWRKRDGDLNNVSWHTQMVSFRVFIQWAETYQAVPQGFSEQIDIPKMKPDEDARDTTFSKERAEDILSYLEKFEYASKKHALFALLWHTGIRIGSARALDVGDFNRREGYIDVSHRPEEGTGLKNGVNGERPISLAEPEVRIISDYIDNSRPDSTDEHGRRPLFSTTHGRAHRGTMRDWVYKLSRPCIYKQGFCPHDKDPESCEARQDVAQISKCPSSFSPHTIRRSSITMWLNEDVPKPAVSDRMNVNDEALDKHYDQRSEKSKMEQRKGYFE
jgi:site-specific recombinase XerD